MAETPKKAFQTPRNSKHQSHAKSKSSPSLTPATLQTLAPRRSSRRRSLELNPDPSPQKPNDRVEDGIGDSAKTPSYGSKTGERSDPKTPRKSINNAGEGCVESVKTPKSAKRSGKLSQKNGGEFLDVQASFALQSPDPSESTRRKRKRVEDRNVVTRAMASSKSEKKKDSASSMRRPKRRVYYKRVVYDGGEFEVGDDVYVKRREDATSDYEEPEMEDCRVCFKTGRAVMIECDDCLGGFHLKCLKPPLKEVPEGDWICGFCEARRLGKEVELPVPPEGKKRLRTMREKLLSSDLWAARIESMWKEVDVTFWCRVCWYIIPEETAAGRQPHNLRRELYRTNDFADIEVVADIFSNYFASKRTETTRDS